MDNINIPWDGWKIVKRIGKGSYGTVYEIERTLDGFTEKAAMKVIPIPPDQSAIDAAYGDGYDDESISGMCSKMRTRILDEYKTMKALSGNSNIVSCEDVGVVPHEDTFGWDVYIRMELLTPLLKDLKTREIQPDDAHKLGMDICQALVLCDEQDIVHRDVKPENIFVSNNGTYKLGDFGIARNLEHTTNATRAGTERYMAPEVIKRDPYGKDVDTYSLGLVMYWLLNGRRMPFLTPGKVPNEAEQSEARSKRLSGEALPEPAYGSKELKDIVLKACAYDREDRYASASDMLQALKSVSETAEKVPERLVMDNSWEPEEETQLLEEETQLLEEETQLLEEEPQILEDETQILEDQEVKSEPEPEPSEPGTRSKTKTEKKSALSNLFKNKKLWIIVALFTICIIGAIVFTIIRFIGSGSFDEQRVLDKLNIDEYKLDDQYVVVLQNNTSHTIDLTGEASFYDKKGNKIDVGHYTEQNIYSLSPDQKDCMIFETEASFYSADVKLSAEESDSNYEPVDFKLEKFEKNSDGTIAFKIKNKGERVRDPISVKYLFYKDGKLIDACQAIYSAPFNAGETLPNSAKIKKPDYDRYESFIGRYCHSGKTGQSSTFDPSKTNTYLKTKEYMPTKQKLIVSVENVSSYNLDIYGTIATYSSDGSLLNAYDDMIRALAPGQKYVLSFHIDEDYNRKDLHLSIDENQEETSLSSDIKIKNIEQHSSNFTFDLENTGNVDAKNVEVVFLFLNGNTLVNLDSTGPDKDSLRAGETASLQIEIPEGDSEKIEWYICGYDDEYSMLK